VRGLLTYLRTKTAHPHTSSMVEYDKKKEDRALGA